MKAESCTNLYMRIKVNIQTVFPASKALIVDPLWGLWPSSHRLQFQAGYRPVPNNELPFVEGLRFKWKVSGYSCNICVTIAPMGMPFQAAHHCHSQLGKTVDDFSWSSLQSTCHKYDSYLEERKNPLPAWILHILWLTMCGVFINKVLPSSFAWLIVNQKQW